MGVDVCVTVHLCVRRHGYVCKCGSLCFCVCMCLCVHAYEHVLVPGQWPIIIQPSVNKI